MGGGGSQTISQIFNLSSINKSIFNQVTKNQQTLATSMNNIQQVDVEFGELLSGCKAVLGQRIDATTTTSGEMSPQTIAETKDIVQAELQAAAQAALEKATEMGNLQFADKQNMSQEINMAVENVVEKTFTTTNINEMYAEIVNIQEGRIKVAVCDGELIFDQTIVAQLTATAITKSLTSAISDNSVLSSLAASAGARGASENKGLTDLVKGFFEGFYGPAKYGIIASVVCCCLLVLVMIVIGLSPAGQSATANLGKAGANRMGRRF